jgi:hypothetical protein
MERAREARRRRVCLSMYSITENIYYPQLFSVTLLLQPEGNCFTDWVLSPYLLSSCGLTLVPTCLLVTLIEARNYFASTIIYSCATNKYFMYLNEKHQLMFLCNCMIEENIFLSSDFFLLNPCAIEQWLATKFYVKKQINKNKL